ncbi:hypothetical protein JL739_09275 [Listeria welshimeri]|uniref:hypothetical protein n=1 Tax=Listeria welshimeri TaxID=1643 RepID=UPI0010B753D9|nr:hypothetical protein [Listeria welshimeri]MBC1248527.1 hypothetical protein [Listeria welshimeri]MBC1621741.1 hypothetical protein [Listeria welshimeri]MBC1663378.1 hypothetical protein [Listeria welshimeri]MBC1673955.1 hypothetical protein [Listeria welshimeri]MBC1681782.1 hypothetical protein [Listeria welshimeri]
MLNDVVKKEKFKDVDLTDVFFESLKNDYPKFEEWFKKKGENLAYVFRDEQKKIQGFLYLKEEIEEDLSIEPVFEKQRRLKVGTFKINAHGTVLGDRFLSIILRKFIEENYSMLYVTIFKKHVALITLFERFGFKKWGIKDNGELVYFKDLTLHDNIYTDFPRFKNTSQKKYLLAIQPQFHTQMFPDSKLKTEKSHCIEDLSFTNTVEKIYITKMVGVPSLKPSDLLLIYRTAEPGKAARYSAVGTSICTVVEYKHIKDFSDLQSFLDYCGKGSIFSEQDLKRFWLHQTYPYIVKMLYNSPLQKRIVRHDLLKKVGLSEQGYQGFQEINDEQFNKILELGEVNEGYVIN